MKSISQGAAHFQDVYEWSGQFRTVNISKGGHHFGSSQFIEMTLGAILQKLPRESFLKNLDRESFSHRCGWYFGEINAIHPFREGNGRTQREFLRQLAAQAGFSLDWRRVGRETMTAASRESFSTGDNGSMTDIIRTCTRKPSCAILLRMELAQWIDHTLLRPDATEAEIAQLCEEAQQYKFYSVCVNPYWVAYAANALEGSNVKICTVAGFPLGATPAAVKRFEAQRSINDGAAEVDMVINVGALKSGVYSDVETDVRTCAEIVHLAGGKLKVILETGLLTDSEKEMACRICVASNADFVKTSTGFAKGGATVEDIQLMRRIVGPKMGVKASGGVRTYADAVKMIHAGATRIGASASIAIVTGSPATSGTY